MRQWWTNKTISEYVDRTECFIKQYDNYYIPEIDEHVRHCNNKTKKKDIHETQLLTNRANELISILD